MPKNELPNPLQSIEVFLSEYRVSLLRWLKPKNLRLSRPNQPKSRQSHPYGPSWLNQSCKLP